MVKYDVLILTLKEHFLYEISSLSLIFINNRFEIDSE